MNIYQLFNNFEHGKSPEAYLTDLSCYSDQIFLSLFAIEQTGCSYLAWYCAGEYAEAQFLVEHDSDDLVQVGECDLYYRGGETPLTYLPEEDGRCWHGPTLKVYKDSIQLVWTMKHDNGELWMDVGYRVEDGVVVFNDPM